MWVPPVCWVGRQQARQGGPAQQAVSVMEGKVVFHQPWPDPSTRGVTGRWQGCPGMHGPCLLQGALLLLPLDASMACCVHLVPSSLSKRVQSQLTNLPGQSTTSAHPDGILQAKRAARESWVCHWTPQG